MGDNLTLKSNFYDWLLKDAQKAGSKIDVSELEGIDAKEAYRKYSNKFQEFLKSANISEENFIENSISIENEENEELDNLFEDYTFNLSKNDPNFKKLDRNHDNVISSLEKNVFLSTINDTGEIDFSAEIQKFEVGNVEKANPFQIPKENIEEVEEDFSLEDFPKINLNVRTLEEINEQLDLISTEQAFYNKNSSSVDLYLEACESVYNESLSEFNEKLKKSGLNNEEIDNTQTLISKTNSQISAEEGALAKNINDLEELKETYKKDDLPSGIKDGIESQIQTLIEQISEQEEKIDSLYEQQNENYNHIAKLVSINSGINSGLYATSRKLSASYLEFSDMKTCQIRIQAQDSCLDASKDLLNNKKAKMV